MSAPVPAHEQPTTTAIKGAFRQVSAEEYQKITGQQGGTAPAGPVTYVDEHPDPQAAADLLAEVDAEVYDLRDPDEAGVRDIPDGAVAVELEGAHGRTVVHVLPVEEWDSAANSALHVGDFESWAAGCLVEGDYDEWLRVAPKMRHVREFQDRFRVLSGQDAGKSRMSPASLRRAAARSKRI